MLAILAKPIDWCVIQSARRCVRLPDEGEGLPEPARTGLSVEFQLPQPADPRDWSWAGEGHFRFRSLVETPSAVNNAVHGRLFPAAAGARCPSVILLHGWNAGFCYRHLFPRLAGKLQRAGWNVAMLELPYHMQRRPRTGPVTDFISHDLRRMLEAARQAMADVHALWTWLHAQGSPCVGVWGFSLGAWLAGLLARTNPSLGFAVLTTPVARMDRVIAELPFCEPVRRGLRGQKVDLQPLNLAAAPPRIDPGRILLVQARHDLFAPAATLEELWRAWEHPQIWRLAHGHISVLMSPRALNRTVEWIRGRGTACR